MKLLIFLFSVITITTALIQRWMVLDLLMGKTVTLNAVKLSLQVGSLPPLYQPLTSVDQSASIKTRSFAEFLRKYFPKSLGNIPPLDPYQPVLDPIPLTFLEPIISGVLRLDGVKITGAQKFKIEDLALRFKYDANRTREDAKISLPSLQVVARFDLDVVIAHLIRVHLTGTFIAQLADVEATVAGGTYLTKLGGEDRVQFNAVEAYASAGEVQVKAQFDDSLAARLALVGVPSQSHLDQMEKEVKESILQMALKNINKVLATFTAQQLRDLLVGSE